MLRRAEQRVTLARSARARGAEFAENAAMTNGGGDGSAPPALVRQVTTPAGVAPGAVRDQDAIQWADRILWGVRNVTTAPRGGEPVYASNVD